MFFRCETATDVYVVDLSKYHISFFNGMVGIYEYDSSDYQPCHTIKLDDIVCIDLSDVEECW